MKSKYILAIHAGHNASACIGDDQEIIFAIQEERLNREKNYWGFPALAIKACLESVRVRPEDLLTVSCGSSQVISKHHSREDVLKSYERQDSLLGKIRQRIAMPLMIKWNPHFGHKILQKELSRVGLSSASLSYHGHHDSHAATAYYGLRTNKAAPYLILTCDGAGDGICASVRVMEKGKVKEVITTSWDHSLGALYAWVTYLMGFMPLEHEYKLMGMAPYVAEESAREMADLFHELLDLDKTGLQFCRKTKNRISDLNKIFRKKFCNQRFDTICAGLQLFTEEILMEWVKNAVRRTGCSQVLAAGGVFMNVKANKKIAALNEVTSFEAFPSCGDETLSLGAYYLEVAKRFGSEAVGPLQHFYLGDDLSEEEVTKELNQSEFKFEKPDCVEETVADILAKGEPLARCCGRMEFGARALGNRSILADPKNLDTVRVINQMVKKRDFWMPFAPVIMEEYQSQYLRNEKNLKSAYMMMAFDTQENYQDFIAAVHSADLTCRAQILSQKVNPSLYAILDAFFRKTGRGLLLNTSFNLHGFPIVRTAKEALKVFGNSGLKYMQLGNWLVSKQS